MRRDFSYLSQLTVEKNKDLNAFIYVLKTIELENN